MTALVHPLYALLIVETHLSSEVRAVTMATELEEMDAQQLAQ